jgi:hypothetical protein
MTDDISSPDHIRHCRILADSFERLVGRPLAGAVADDAELARMMFEAPQVIASHGLEADPVLNYGNLTALDLWELSWDDFTSTPSRKTAEPVHRDERARMLAEATANGYIANYSGIRIASTGKRFFIREAIIWNLHDENGAAYGQAATFDQWEWIE